MTRSDLWGYGEQDTINAVLRRAVQRWGGKPFLDFQGAVYSYTDTDREARRLANGLSRLGVRKGDTVVSLLDNSADAVFLWLAINKLGAICVPVNTAFKGEYLRHQVSDAGAAIVVAESDYAERVDAVADSLPELKTLVCRGGKPDLKRLGGSALGFEEIRCGAEEDPEVAVEPEDLAFLIYTGGTTGPSKGCMISHNYACNVSAQIGIGTGRSSASVSWTPLPVFHFNVYTASLICNMRLGARVALYPRFSVSNFWPEIERTGANDAMLLGAMIPMVLSAPETEVERRCHGKLEAISGAPFPSGLMEAWKKRYGAKRAFCPGFGLTECALLTLTPATEYAKPDSSGKRNDSFDVRIVADNGNEVSDGTPGEIIVRPKKPHVMFEGYWRRPEETLKTMKDLWFHTGDIGKFDEDGYFYFVDRKKDYLRRRGENVSSFEVETTFRKHPAIEDVAVHAVPSDLTEDEIKICVILREGSKLAEEELCLWSVDQLPYFAVPRYIEFRTELPRSPVGRVLKYKLREEGLTPATWDREKAGIKITRR